MDFDCFKFSSFIWLFIVHLRMATWKHENKKRLEVRKTNSGSSSVHLLFGAGCGTSCLFSCPEDTKQWLMFRWSYYHLEYLGNSILWGLHYMLHSEEHGIKDTVCILNSFIKNSMLIIHTYTCTVTQTHTSWSRE